MLYKSIFRRALTLQLTHCSFRSFSSSPPFAFASTPAMASPTDIRSFTLDRNIFNDTLYSHLRDFWFSELPANASTMNDASMNKWYGRDLSPEQKEAQDEECRRNFGHALEVIGPDRLALPAFESAEVDVREAGVLSRPFLEEVKEAQRQDEEKGSETLLSLVILLDQITRNIYRDTAGLKLVFNHYDRLAHALVHSSLALDPSPILHDSHRLRPVIRQWFLMPLMHSEHLPSHHIFNRLVAEAKQEAAKGEDEGAVWHCDNALSFEKMHMEPLERFGRYPHRNEALGRTNSKEEEAFLEKGETFGVKQGGGDEKEEVKEKSEL